MERKSRRAFDFEDVKNSVRSAEQEITVGMSQPEQGVGEAAEAGHEKRKLTQPDSEQPSMSARQDEPTKAVHANLPMSIYNRMKRLKFETDEPFQSMFQRALSLFLDVEEGKITIYK